MPRHAAGAMTLLTVLQRIYSLDTLDTRLTVSSSTPIKAVSQSPTREQPLAGKDGRAQEIAASAQPSKWNTVEFYCYALVFLTMVPLMFKTVMDVSKGACCVLCAQLSVPKKKKVVSDGTQRVSRLTLITREYCLLDGFLDAKWYVYYCFLYRHC